MGELNTIIIVALVILAFFAAFSIIASIWKVIVAARYVKYNNVQVKAELTGGETAQKMLEGLQIKNVEVVKCGFFSGLFFGNSYNPFKKKIKLRKNIYDKKSLTAVAIATQKVALAKRDFDGDKKIKVRTLLSYLGYFSPFAVLPLFLLGVLLDYVVYKNLGIITFILVAIAAVWYLASFVVLCLNIPIEKRANKDALEFFKKTNMLNEEEYELAEKLYKTYIINYVLDFISELLYIIWRILKLCSKLLQLKKK